MPDNAETQGQFTTITDALSEMSSYLQRLAQGCGELPGSFHAADKGQPLEALTRIMEGISYCPQLLHAALAPLCLDAAKELWQKVSVASFSAELNRVFTDLDQAAENGDFSVLADVVEYDLLPVIQTGQALLRAIQQRYTERIV